MATLKVEGRLDTKGFNTGANQMRQQMKSMQADSSKANTSLASFAKTLQGSGGALGSFGGALSGVIGKLGPMAAALAVVGAGFEAVKLAFKSTENLADEYGRVQEATSSVINAFGIAMANLDFSNLFNGLDEIIRRSTDAYNAVDNLESLISRYNPETKSMHDEISALRAQARAAKAAGDEKKALALIDKANAKQQEANRLDMYKAITETNTGYKQLRELTTNYDSSVKFTQADFNELKRASNWDKTNAAAAQYKANKAEYDKATTKLNNMDRWTNPEEWNRLNSKVSTLESYFKSNKGQQDKKAYIFQDLRDDTETDAGKKFNEAINRTYAEQNRRNQQAMEQAMLDRIEGTLTRESKSGSGKKVEKTYLSQSLGWYETTIKQLEEKLKDINIELNPDEYRAVKKQIDELTLEKTILFELDVDEIQLMKLQAKAKELQDVLKAQISVGMNQSYITNTIKQLNEINRQKEDIKLGVELYLDPVKRFKTELDIAKQDLNLLIVTHADTSEIETKLLYIKQLEKQLENFNITVDYNLNKDKFKKEFEDLFKEDPTQAAINKFNKQFNSIGTPKQVENPVTEQDININMNINTSIYDELIGKLEKLTEVKKKLDEHFKTAVAAGDYQMMEQLAIAYYETDKNIQKTTESINTLIVEQNKLNKQKDASNKKDKQTKETQMMLNGLASSLQSAGAAFGAFAEESQAAATAQKAFTIAAAVAQLVAQFASVPKGVEIWSWIAGTAAGVATLVTAIASIKSASKFAQGGIVSGSSFSGDYNIARVNSGEMILNGTQQARLFRLLNSDGIGTGNAGVQEIRLKAKGRDLVGVANNYNNRRNKI